MKAKTVVQQAEEIRMETKEEFKAALKELRSNLEKIEANQMRRQIVED